MGLPNQNVVFGDAKRLDPAHEPSSLSLGTAKMIEAHNASDEGEELGGMNMKSTKKLTLSKETLAVLTAEQTKLVGGGAISSTNDNCCSIPCGTDACNLTKAATCPAGCNGGGGTVNCGGGGGTGSHRSCCE